MSRRGKFSNLCKQGPIVLPSMLLCDFSNLRDEIEQLEAAGAEGFHMDVMDGMFVPNFTYGMTIIEATRSCTSLPIDVHLMIQQPEKYIKSFYDAGADMISFHAEAVNDPQPVLEMIRNLGADAAIAINPATSIAEIENSLPHCDMVLVMSVDAGFGGQSFNPIALEKLRRLRDRLPDDVMLQVDGGINSETIGQCAAAGAELFVVGSGIFRSDDYRTSIKQLTDLAVDHKGMQ